MIVSKYSGLSIGGCVWFIVIPYTSNDQDKSSFITKLNFILGVEFLTSN